MSIICMLAGSSTVASGSGTKEATVVKYSQIPAR